MSAAASTFGEPRVPVSTSSSGGFHNANSRSPRGDPSSTTGRTDTPHNAEARAAGSPTVADVKMN